MVEILNKIPLASILAVLAAVGGVIALVSGSISYDEFLIGLGVTTGGAGVLGEARNRAGHGTK